MATALVIDEEDRFGPFLYCPRGPVVDYNLSSRTDAVLNLLRRELRPLNSRAICLRLDPPVLAHSAATKPFRRLGFRPAGKFTQVERAWICDLQPDQHGQIEWQKTHGMRGNLPRYLRRAEREGVVVRSSSRAGGPGDLSRHAASFGQPQARDWPPTSGVLSATVRRHGSKWLRASVHRRTRAGSRWHQL